MNSEMTRGHVSYRPSAAADKIPPASGETAGIADVAAVVAPDAIPAAANSISMILAIAMAVEMANYCDRIDRISYAQY